MKRIRGLTLTGVAVSLLIAATSGWANCQLRFTSGAFDAKSYEGECPRGFAQGRGVAVVEVQSRPIRYNGNFVDGVASGPGRMTTLDNSLDFMGEVRNWMPYDGHAVERTADGQVHHYQFSAGRQYAVQAPSPEQESASQQQAASPQAPANPFADALKNALLGALQKKVDQSIRQSHDDDHPRRRRRNTNTHQLFIIMI